MTIQTIPYYDYRELLSRNGVYNFAVGGRGIGKTYGAIKMAIRDYFKRGEQFIYLRRYEDELTASKATFASDLAGEFPDKEFRTNGNNFEVVTKYVGGEINEKTGKKSAVQKVWETVGYFRVLSKAQDYKGSALPRVTKIIFDEFIIEKGFKRYLPDEHIVFNNFFYTVNRTRNNTRVFFLANAVTMNNPYFDEYEIRPDQLPELSNHFPVVDPETKNTRPFIVVHFIDSEEFNKAAYATVFGQFIQGTEYAKYAVENNFADSHGQLVKGKTPTAKYEFSLETTHGTFSVWYDRGIQTFFILRKRAKKEFMLTMIEANMSDKKKLVRSNDEILRRLRTHFDSARVFFDSPRSRNAFIPVMKR